MSCSKILYKRRVVELTGEDLEDNKDDYGEFRAQMKRLHRKKISQVHPNQRKAAADVIHKFTNNPELLMILAVGKTQSGKTGVMYSIIQEYTTPDVSGYVPVKNVYIITGLSSNEWKEQTMKRIPGIIRGNVYHRPELSKFMEDIKDKTNILVLIDEVQIACKKSQTISKDFETCGLLNKQFLMDNDIKIVEFSATPNGTLKDSKLWGENSEIVKIEPGANYKSCIDLNNENRVYQCKNLCDSPDVLDTIRDIQNKIETYDTCRYHFIRTKVGFEQVRTVENFKQVFGDSVTYIHHDCKNEDTLDKYLDETSKGFVGKPKKHAFIFLKEMARCAKTYKKKYIGIWYERCVNKFNDDIVIQGLLGRATGYDDNGDSIIYTNISSIERYEELWESDFSDKVEWSSNSTTYSQKKGITKSKKTFNSEITQGGLYSEDEEEDVTYVKTDIYHKSDDESLEEFWNKYRTKSARQQFKDSNRDENGFFKTSTSKVKKSYLLSEIEEEVSQWTGCAGFCVTKCLDDYKQDDRIQSRIYVCYRSFDEGMQSNPSLYIRHLYKK
jgi:hypothetical protein